MLKSIKKLFKKETKFSQHLKSALKNEYVKKTEDYILPMLKQAQKVNPHQSNVYENEKLVLKTQLNIIKLNLGLNS